MTEEGPAPGGVSLVRTMLGRLRVQPSPGHPDQRSKHTDQNNHRLVLDLNKRRSSLASTDTLSLADSDVDSGYAESRPSSLVFPEWKQRNLLSKRLPELPENRQEVEPGVGQNYFSSPAHGPLTFGSNGSSVSVPDPDTTPYRKNGPAMEPCRSQVSFVGKEEPQKPPLPPKQRRRNAKTLHRNFTFRDFQLNIGPINLVEELLSGAEWAPYLPPKNLSPKTEEARDQSQTQNAKHTSRHAEIKPELSDEEEMSEVRLDQTSVTVPTEQNLTNQASQSEIFAVHKSKYKYGTIGSWFKVSDGADSGPEVFPNKDLLYNNSIDRLFGFKPGDLLDNSAQKSRIKLSKKRKHRPPNKSRTEETEAPYLPPKNLSPKTEEARDQSQTQNAKHTSRHAEIKPELSDEEEMSEVRLDQTSVAVPTEQNLTNQASQSEIFAVHKSKYKYGTIGSWFKVSDGADLSPEVFPNKDLLYNNSLDRLFGFKPGDLLDNSAQKSRIKLSKKRKHRPPNKSRTEKTDTTLKIPQSDHDRNRSESAPSNSQVFGNSKFYVLPRSQSCEDPQALGRDDLNQNNKDNPVRIKLWRPWK